MRIDQSRPLQEVLLGWPEQAPSNLEELSHISDSGLEAILESVPEANAAFVRYIHGQTRQVISASLGKSTALGSISAIRQAIEDRMIRPPADRWTLYPLLSDFRRVPRDEASEGSSRFKVKVSGKCLEPNEIIEHDLVPPKGGKLLLIWGGSPELLDESPGVLKRIQSLLSAGFDLVDVVFVDTDEDGTTQISSLRSNAAEGSSGELNIASSAFEKGAALWRNVD